VLRRRNHASTSQLRTETGLSAETVKGACAELVERQMAVLTELQVRGSKAPVYRFVASDRDDEEGEPPKGGPSSSRRNDEDDVPARGRQAFLAPPLRPAARACHLLPRRPARDRRPR